MKHLKIYHKQDLLSVTKIRRFETKLGERIQVIADSSQLEKSLQESTANYVLFGIPEDIGVKANLGRIGAASAYDSALQSLANIQHNKFNKGYNIVVLGQLDVKTEMEEIQNLDFTITSDRKRMSELVVKIDKEVAHIITQIVKAGKTPIVIGGGVVDHKQKNYW